jgi:hypothetical protein
MKSLRPIDGGSAAALVKETEMELASQLESELVEFVRRQQAAGSRRKAEKARAASGQQ